MLYYTKIEVKTQYEKCKNHFSRGSCIPGKAFPDHRFGLTSTPTTVSVSDAKKVQRLADKLDELEDVQNVYNTMDVTDEIAAALDED